MAKYISGHINIQNKFVQLLDYLNMQIKEI